MQLVPKCLLAVCALSATASAQFIDSVINYQPGTTAAAGYTNTSAVLGGPSAQTVDPTFGTSPVDPFSPPYLKTQLLSVGANGSLTVHFATPVLNLPGNPFGIDFSVFGDTGFVITNGDFSGGGITDGTLFGNNTGSTRVSVSADGVTYYTLNPSLAPIVDAGLPTDGNGNPMITLDPALKGTAFSGKNLDQIRALYKGSAGGAGYDIAWAQDANGNAVALDKINFVKIDVLSGHSEIDALVAVPEPTTLLLTSLGGLALFVASRKFRRNERA